MNISNKIFKCALGYEDEHFIERPITLPCGHCSCFECIKRFKENTSLKEVKCDICGKLNSLENDYSDSILAQSLKESNLQPLIEDLLNQCKETFNSLKNKTINMQESVDTQIKYAKDEIEIRAESLKIEIDQIKDKFTNKLDQVKNEFFNNVQRVNLQDNQLILDFHNKKLEINQKTFSRLQSKLSSLKRSMIYLESLGSKICLNLSEETISNELFGSINYNFVELNDSSSEEIEINLEVEPLHCCSLPNNNLLVSSDSSNCLKMLNSDLKTIKTINKINNESFTPRYITTDGLNKIYFTALKSRVIKTDLDIKFIKEFGSKGCGNENLDKPCGISYFEKFIYVCDYNNRRIQKLNEDLVYKESYPLNFKPWEIEIKNNVACVRSGAETSLVFYNLNPFYLKIKVSNVNGCISSFNSWFYQYNQRKELFSCYNTNGELVNEKDLKANDLKKKNSGLVINYFDEKLIKLKK